MQIADLIILSDQSQLLMALPDVSILVSILTTKLFHQIIQYAEEAWCINLFSIFYCISSIRIVQYGDG